MLMNFTVFFSLISCGNSAIHELSMNGNSFLNWKNGKNTTCGEQYIPDKISPLSIPPHQISLFQYPETKLSDAIILVNIAVFTVFNLSWISKFRLRFIKSNLRISRGDIYRLFTPMFMHQTTLHIFLNMMSLKVYGPMVNMDIFRYLDCFYYIQSIYYYEVEKWYGSTKFLAVYLASGIISNLITFLMNVSPLSLGASGAIYGLVGALSGFFCKNRLVLGHSAEIGLNEIRMDLLLNLVFSAFIPNIDHFGHLGGFLGGLLVSLVLAPKLKLKNYTMLHRRGNGSSVADLIDA